MTYVHSAWEYKAQGVTAAQMNMFYGMAVMALAWRRRSPRNTARARSPTRGPGLHPAHQGAYVDEEIESMGTDFRHAAA